MEAGVNRLSLGVQTLNLESLRTVGRAQELFTFGALNILEVQKFENVNVDFIIGLPCVKNGEIKDSIGTLLEKYPCIKHVSVYMLEDEKYPQNWRELSLQVEDYESEFLGVQRCLLEKGFIHYELSNFAKPGYESKHNRAYWTHENYRGFGLSAASFLDGKRFTNGISFDRYYKGEKIEEETLSSDQLEFEDSMFRLRTFRGVPKSRIQDKERLKHFIFGGFVREENNAFFLNST